MDKKTCTHCLGTGNSIEKKVGRPRGEPKRQVRMLWSLEAASFLEEHREWIEENRELLVKKAKYGCDVEIVDEVKR